MPQHSNNGSNISPLFFRNHTALLLATALPFLQPAYQHPVELITKFLELSETLKLFQKISPQNDNPFSNFFRDINHFDKDKGLLGLINTFILDIEGMLESLSCVCTGKEKDIINILLNLMQAKNFYENYGDILNTFLSSDMFQNTSESQSTPTDEQNMPDMASMFSGGGMSSMLNKEQADTINLLKNLLDAE